MRGLLRCLRRRFYLGILLSIVFALAAVLIIYYKQVSEGYEDQASFDIMAKVGMTEKDINSAVNSQILTVFFIPLVFSAIHLCFAFPMIKKILELFALMNDGLFILTTALSFAVFTLFLHYRLPPHRPRLSRHCEKQKRR